MGENLGFTHNDWTNFFACYVSVKRGNINFNGDLETKKIIKLFEEYHLASEGWSKIKYRIEVRRPGLSSNTNLLFFPKRVNFFVTCLFVCVG